MTPAGDAVTSAVIAAVSAATGVSGDEIVGRRLRASTVEARFLVVYLLRVDYEMTLDRIGRLLDRDHSTSCPRSAKPSAGSALKRTSSRPSTGSGRCSGRTRGRGNAATRIPGDPRRHPATHTRLHRSECFMFPADVLVGDPA